MDKGKYKTAMSPSQGGLRAVTPMSDLDLKATVSANAGGSASLTRHAVTVHSISNVGVSLRLSAESHLALKPYDDLLLSLHLPDRPAPSTIFCHVRHRGMNGEGFLYSCEYDWSATMDPLGVVEDLVGFMLDAED